MLITENREFGSDWLPTTVLVELNLDLTIRQYFKPIRFRLTATVRGMEPTGPSECCPVEWSTDWGCPWSRRCAESPPQAVTIAEEEYSQLAYSEWWSNAARFEPVFAFFLLCFFKWREKTNAVQTRMKRKTECCAGWDDGRQRVEEPSSDTKCCRQGRQCGRSSTIRFYLSTCIWQLYESHTEIEREREAQKDYFLIQ